MENKHGLIWGILLILLGGFFLAERLIPGIYGQFTWPFYVMGAGAMFLLAAILTRTGGLAIPGCIIGGIGGILYYQTITNRWESWSFMWTLIPGFVGVGVIFAGLLDRERPHFETGGLVLMAISAMGFLIFGSAFGALFGYDFEFGMLWPLFLIGIGVITLISALFRRR